jgi:hypothetical protein
MARGRQSRGGLPGSSNPNAAMTEETVKKILELLAEDDSRKMSKLILSRFGITKTMLYGIRHGTSWKHVTLERRPDDDCHIPPNSGP